MKTKIKKHYDVAIIGAGPCGVTAANMLGQQGIQVLLIDKEKDIVDHPRAVGLCEEGSRILDSANLLDPRELELRYINSVHFRNKCKKSVFHVDLFPSKSGHRQLRTFHQPDLEQHLRDSLKTKPDVDFLTCAELKSFSDQSSGVDLVINHEGINHDVSCRYLLACDGASSSIRKKLNIGFSGDTYPQDWMILDIENNPIPSSEVVFSINPDRPSVSLPGPGSKRRWEFVIKDSDDPEKLFAHDNLKNLLSDWGDVSNMNLYRKAVYTFHARTAEHYRSGNIFLLGDAAHITPPFAGQGMMAGLRDAQNLCWKLTAVLQERLKPKILETYESERIPQSQQVIKFAQFMGSIILPQKKWIATIRDGFLKTLGALGFHSDIKGLGIEKIPNHINGSFLAHMFKSKLIGTGIQLPQHEVQINDAETPSDRVIGSDFYLLGWKTNPENFLSNETKKRWRSINGQKVMFVDDINRPNSKNSFVVIDQHRHYKCLLKSGKRVLVVRPDKMIVKICSLKNLDQELNSYLNDIGSVA